MEHEQIRELLREAADVVQNAELKDSLEPIAFEKVLTLLAAEKSMAEFQMILNDAPMKIIGPLVDNIFRQRGGGDTQT